MKTAIVLGLLAAGAGLIWWGTMKQAEKTTTARPASVDVPNYREWVRRLKL